MEWLTNSRLIVVLVGVILGGTSTLDGGRIVSFLGSVFLLLEALMDFINDLF